MDVSMYARIFLYMCMYVYFVPVRV